MKFSELNLPLNISKALNRMGFEELTPVQEATYPIISAGQDLCALAETGSGKTAACAIPLVQMVDAALNTIQALVIVPTRELCLQYVDEIDRIAAGTGIAVISIYGGSCKDIQSAQIKHKAHIVVATPGRLMDFVYSGVIDLSDVKCAILDEADELLKEGFLSEIKFLLSCIRNKHQTLLFSATMAEDIKKLAHDFLIDPQYISLVHERPTPKAIDHYFCYLNPKNKQPELLKYLEKENIRQLIIFCNARYLVDKLFHDLKRKLKGIEYIHAGLMQDRRTMIFHRFKQQKVRYLIATDVAGRGLDFSHVSHIVNWNLPIDQNQYAHRIGRTGRMGRKGKAFTFILRHELPDLKAIIHRNKITPHWIGKNPL